MATRHGVYLSVTLSPRFSLTLTGGENSATCETGLTDPIFFPQPTAISAVRCSARTWRKDARRLRRSANWPRRGWRRTRGERRGKLLPVHSAIASDSRGFLREPRARRLPLAAVKSSVVPPRPLLASSLRYHRRRRRRWR